MHTSQFRRILPAEFKLVKRYPSLPTHFNVGIEIISYNGVTFFAKDDVMKRHMIKGYETTDPEFWTDITPGKETTNETADETVQENDSLL